MTSRVRAQWILRGFMSLAAALLLVLLSRTPIVRAFGTRLVAMVGSPFLRGGIALEEVGEVYFTSKRDLIDELRTLERQQAELLRIAVESETARRDLDEARTLLAYRERSIVPSVAAKVLLRTTHDGEEELVINRGSQDRIQNNDPVLASDGSLVGVVREAYPTTSRVMLVTNTQSLVGATVSDRGTSIGIVQGQAESLLRFEFIPQAASLEVDDLVLTSGVDPNIPADLALGLVNSVNRDPNAAFFDALVEPIADLSAIRIVDVLLTHDL